MINAILTALRGRLFGWAVLAVFLAGCVTGWKIQGWHLFASNELALANQKTALEASCAEDKAITKGVADALQTKNTDLANRIAALKRVQSTCIVPTPNASIGSNAAAPVLPGAHGVTSESLYDFAGDCEHVSNALMACQNFIRQTWKKNGQ